MSAAAGTLRRFMVRVGAMAWKEMIHVRRDPRTLAQTPAGLTCFLAPRWLPDGTKNAIEFVRLKRKMGNVSNASCETELRGALAWMVGEEGRGLQQTLATLDGGRIGVAFQALGIGRACLEEAVAHAKAGADIIVPDYRELEALLEYLEVGKPQALAKP